MIRRLTAITTLALMAAVATTSAAAADEEVRGTFDLTWNDCAVIPSESIPDWIGTVDIDGDAYDMIFFNLGTGRPPNHAVEPPLGSFIEIWAIYDGLEVVFDEECALQKLEGDLALWGHDYGTGNLDEATFGMSGTVVEGFGEFAELAGRDIEMNGTFFVDPDTELEKAPGEFIVS